MMKRLSFALSFALLPFPVLAAPANVDFTVAMSEAVTVSGCPATCPRIAIDVGGQTRYAQYSAGSGSSSLTFSYAPTIGDLDLDGVTLSSPVDLNGGTMTDLNGNPITNLTFTVPNTTGIKINYPSLSMDFTNGASGRYTLNGTAYTDFSSFLGAASGTFTRATTATYYDSTGTLQTASINTPRFDHDPVTLTPKGILIEEARTNYLHYTNFQLNWNISRVSRIFNATIAPNGVMSATELIEDNTGGGPHGTNPSTGYIPFVAGQHYTFSIYVKRGAGARNIVVGSGDANIIDLSARFNLGTGAIIAASAGVTALITNIGNGWFRCSVSNVALTTTPNYVSFSLMQGDAAYSYYTGNGIDSLYVWGPQVEQGAFPTSYIPTTSSAVTRSADNFIIPTGSWYNSLEGTIAGQFYLPSFTGQHGIFSLNDGTLNNKSDLRSTGNAITSVSGVNQENTNIATSSLTTNKFAKAIAVNNYGLSINNSAPVIDSSALVPTVSQLQIGGLDGSLSYSIDSTINNLKYYPSRVPDAQLQLLTQ